VHVISRLVERRPRGLDAALVGLFIVFAAFYLWTAGSSSPLQVGGAIHDPYNELANAFLHGHLYLRAAPPGLVHLADPYDPIANASFRTAYGVHDLALYHGRLYTSWGPTPAVVLLLPLRVLGLTVSMALTDALFAIAGLAFALAALRALARKLGDVPRWMAVLAGLALTLSTAVPFLLRRPDVYEAAIASGYCFTMAGIWLALTIVTAERVSARRLALMSLCFGLAFGARPTLGIVALVMVPCWWHLRGTVPRRRLLASLLLPVGVCGSALMAYNAARFGDPFEVGGSYVLAGINQHVTRLGDPAYVPPGIWYYLVAPPRPSIVFPFLRLGPPPFYPGSVPAQYGTVEITGGLLPMTPIVVLALALPWLARRRPTVLGAAATPLMVGAGAGLAILLFVAYEFTGTTERYEVDFVGLVLLAALAGWLGLERVLTGRRARLLRLGGAVLVVWGCLTGLAISFNGYYNLLKATHPGVWRTLEGAGSPLSTLMAMVAGRPVIAEVSAPILQTTAVGYTTVGAGVSSFALGVHDSASITVVSPDRREAALVASLSPGPVAAPRATVTVIVASTHAKSTTKVLPGGPQRLPIQLRRGINHLTLSSAASRVMLPNPSDPAGTQLLRVERLYLSPH
jgi:hypothetical protein